MGIITISREFGSRGKEIGRSLAETLGYEYVDRGKIIDEMKAIGSRWGRVAEEFDHHYPNVWERYDWSFRGYLALTQSIILNYGLKDRIVLMGGGGNFIFKDIPYALRVRITMPVEARIARIMKEDDFTRGTASWVIEKSDKEMADAVYLIYGRRWDDANEYDMKFDLGVQEEDDVIKTILEASAEKEKLNTEEARKKLRTLTTAARVKAGIAMNRSFMMVPTLDVKIEGDSILLHGIVHKPKEKEEIEKEAKKFAGDVPIEFDLHYRGFLRSKL
jgi:cytidylate kinase